MPLSQNGKPPTLVGDIDARLDRQGKIFALFVLNGGRWFEWQQGKLPRETLLHHGRHGSWKFAISPNLKTVLIAHALSARAKERRVGKECVRPGRFRWSP